MAPAVKTKERTLNDLVFVPKAKKVILPKKAEMPIMTSIMPIMTMVR